MIACSRASLASSEAARRYVQKVPSPAERAAGAQTSRSAIQPPGGTCRYAQPAPTLWFRFILANTEQLHEKIKAMSGRIRALEDALGEVQSSHPLLREDLLLIKKSADLFGVDPTQMQPAVGEGSKRADSLQLGLATPVSPPMQSDVRQVATAVTAWLTRVSQRQSQSPPANGSSDDWGIPPEILRVAERFPSPSALTFDLNPSFRKRILDLLPPQHEARYLCEQAAEHAAWQCVFEFISYPPPDYYLRLALLFLALFGNFNQSLTNGGLVAKIQTGATASRTWSTAFTIPPPRRSTPTVCLTSSSSWPSAYVWISGEVISHGPRTQNDTTSSRGPLSLRRR